MFWKIVAAIHFERFLSSPLGIVMIASSIVWGPLLVKIILAAPGQYLQYQAQLQDFCQAEEARTGKPAIQCGGGQ
ncbi:MAG: hypothetical protein ACRCYP_01720 [Alphaproteobacteria bacterium]